MSAPTSLPSPVETRERRRVRAHLHRAERAARRAPITADPLRRVVRALLLDELAHYRARGLFPRNTVVPELHPVFVDELGTRCAVAHLLDASGQSALVADLAARRNLAYVAELADEPALVAWLDAAGLTLAEAAAIQPGYPYAPNACVCGRVSFGNAPPYAVPATAVLDVQLLAGFDGYYPHPVDGTVVAIDGHTADYAVGQTVAVTIASANGPIAAGAVVLAPVGGVASGTSFDLPRPPFVADGGTPDGGPLPLGAYELQDGAINCAGAIGPLPRATFVRAVETSSCKAVLDAVDPRWSEVHGLDDGSGCACSVPAGTLTAPSTLGLLLALLALRRSRRRPA